MDTKTDIVNYLGRRFNFTSFLEISTSRTGFGYDRVNSDIFKTKEILFYTVNNYHSIRSDVNKKLLPYQKSIDVFRGTKFDVIFVDPWHTVEHSIIDIYTAISLVKDNGFIVIHDCNPPIKEYTGPYHDGGWCGQTYEAFIRFRLENPNISCCVVDIDMGCAVIRKNKVTEKAYSLENNLTLTDVVNWNYFSNHRKQLLNLLSVREFIEKYL